MPRGGARIGAGRKPTPRFAVIDGAVDDVPVDVSVSLIPPGDMPTDQRPYWQMYAPLARERRTLTAATVPAFRLLCELEAERAAVKRTLDTDGRTYVKVTIDGAGQEQQELKAHPLKTDYARLAKQVEVLLARFTLAPFGKPATSGVAQTPAAARKAAIRAKFFGGQVG